jgi:endonuclease YncB( thermonuclease family)
VAPKSKRYWQVSRKTLSQQLGVFFACLLWLAGFAAADNCPAKQSLEWLDWERLVDGDTLRLSDGRKLRVVGINTPELARGQRLSEPLASEAKNAASEFLKDSGKVGLAYGTQAKDHYGRLLADVYRSDGQSLSAYLISKGLAQLVVIPPNLHQWQCLRILQQRARQQKIGLWQQAYYLPRQAGQLSAADAGFRRVTGVVNKVTVSHRAVWLELGRLAVRIASKQQHHFADVDFTSWQGQTLELSGWLIDRSDSAEVERRGFQPFLMQLGHPAMVTVIQ